MIVHILPSASGFPAVNYNTKKVDRNKGELMKVSNFGALQGLQQLRPEDYKIHLRMLAATNKHVRRPQFHAVISVKGKESDKHVLTEVAEKWLAAMGYGKQPYLVIFHKDTNNNHVHVVTSRVDHAGKKISDRFEKIRAVQQLNIILGIDVKHNVASDIASALTYRFATKAQFMMILESRGYMLKEADDKMLVIKFGKQQGEIELKDIDEKLQNYRPESERKNQIKAFFHKYAAIHSTVLFKGPSGYSSDFSALLKEKFGINLLFDASGDKPPYGYTVIDHSGKQVFKGGEVMPLKELLDARLTDANVAEDFAISIDMNSAAQPVTKETAAYYSALLKAALHNYPDLVQGLRHQGLMIYRNGESFNLADPGAGVSIGLEDLLNKKDYALVAENFSQSQVTSKEDYQQHHPIRGVNLASDMDDEAIHARNRRRKKKARTNSR